MASLLLKQRLVIAKRLKILVLASILLFSSGATTSLQSDSLCYRALVKVGKISQAVILTGTIGVSLLVAGVLTPHQLQHRYASKHGYIYAGFGIHFDPIGVESVLSSETKKKLEEGRQAGRPEDVVQALTMEMFLRAKTDHEMENKVLSGQASSIISLSTPVLVSEVYSGEFLTVCKHRAPSLVAHLRHLEIPAYTIYFMGTSGKFDEVGHVAVLFFNSQGEAYVADPTLVDFKGQLTPIAEYVTKLRESGFEPVTDKNGNFVQIEQFFLFSIYR
jgi:hypothetical protein